MIRLEKCGIDDEKLASLGGVLKHTKRDLVKLFLDSNEITDAGTVTDTCVSGMLLPGSHARAVCRCGVWAGCVARRSHRSEGHRRVPAAEQSAHPPKQAH
jgi:hypothetical protein|eukprot:COSAG01_NODE_12707_length_1697_cov_1.367334_2_plen_100_part_00